DGAHARIPVGSFKIGLIAAVQKPHLTNNVQTDERVSDKEWARREDMISFAGYPLVVEGRTVGVMAMFARQSLDQDAIEALESVAPVIAQGIERKRTEDALRLDWGGWGYEALTESQIAAILKEFPRLEMKKQFTGAVCRI